MSGRDYFAVWVERGRKRGLRFGLHVLARNEQRALAVAREHGLRGRMRVFRIGRAGYFAALKKVN